VRHADLVAAIVSAIALIMAIKFVRRRRGATRWLILLDRAFVVPDSSTSPDFFAIAAAAVLIYSVSRLFDADPGTTPQLLLVVFGWRTLTMIGYHDPVTMRPTGVTIRRMLLPDFRYSWAELADRPGLLRRLGIDPRWVRPDAVVSRLDRCHRPIWWRPAIERGAYAQILRGYLDQPWRHHLIGTGAEADRLLLSATQQGSVVAPPAFVEPAPRLLVVPESYRPRRGDALRPGDTGSRSD
jgi:hypothetical protein